MSAKQSFISARSREAEMGAPFFEDAWDDEAQMHGEPIDAQGFADYVNDEPEMGRSLLKTIGRGLSSVARHPLTKVVAGGVAFAFPPVGVPLVAGVAVADQLVTAAQSANPKRKAAASKIVKRTVAAAKAGDKDAGRAARILSAVARKKKAVRGQPREQRAAGFAKAYKRQEALKALLAKAKSGKGLAGPTVKGFLVTPLGRVQAGNYRKA